MRTHRSRLLALLCVVLLALGASACSDDGGEDDGNGPSDLSDVSDVAPADESPTTTAPTTSNPGATSTTMSGEDPGTGEEAPPVSSP
jgi:hypothetical protein